MLDWTKVAHTLLARQPFDDPASYRPLPVEIHSYTSSRPRVFHVRTLCRAAADSVGGKSDRPNHAVSAIGPGESKTRFSAKCASRHNVRSSNPRRCHSAPSIKTARKFRPTTPSEPQRAGTHSPHQAPVTPVPDVFESRLPLHRTSDFDAHRFAFSLDTISG